MPSRITTQFWRKGLVLAIFAVICSPLLAGDDIPDERYKASTIPVGLLKDANAVIRWQKMQLTVRNEHKAILTMQSIITVLNAEGREFGEMSLWYDKFRRVGDLDGRLFDANGKEIRSLEKSDIEDHEASSWYSLYEDNRVRSASLYHSIYPYTIEWNYELDFDGYINWPSWYPEQVKASVQQSAFEVDLPGKSPLRYRKTFPGEPLVTKSGDITSYVWEADSLSPVDLEPLGPPWENQLQCVRVAPTQFEIDGHEGSLSSWQAFGSWFYELYRNRQGLPETEQRNVLDLTKMAINDSEKVRLLYEHLQSKTRYVSIQLGIGGWQPFDASYVCQKGYGDCKALSNYMMALLKAVNITSYPVLIYSDNLPVDLSPDFPINEFNHVILCVPLQQDSIWLECTSQTIPFGHLSLHTQNRYALLVTPDGGVLVHTPTPKADENCQIRKATVTLETTGDASAEVHALFTGDQQDYVRSGLRDAPPIERDKWVKDYIEIAAYDLGPVDFNEVDKKSDSINISLQLKLPHYASRAGARLLFQPSLLEKSSTTPRSIEHRKHHVMISYPYLDLDTITYVLPGNCMVEALPKPVSITKGFGSYESKVTPSSNGSLVYTRRLEISFTDLPPEQYEDYRLFRRDIAQADKANAALVRTK
jgi:transglutaminase-like putative cysteine protease